MNNDNHDLIIIGASAAGVSAAIYAARRNLKFLVISKDIGGEVINSGEIENYPGIKHTNGIELTQKFIEQLEYYKVKIEQMVQVDKVEKSESGFNILARKDNKELVLTSKTVIIATGIHPRVLPVPEESKLKGKGLSYCTTCDGPLFKNKITATIGGGNSALESVLMLAELSPKVYLINKNPTFRGDNTLISKVEANNKIKVIYNAKTTHLLGDKRVSGLIYTDKNDKEIELKDIEGLFVHIGMIPNSDLVSDEVEKNKTGEIIVTKECHTNIPGLFAAGDVTDIPYKQIAVATGQGVSALLSAVNFLNKLSD
ncbi:NAD(P)/FAD-dependent oxidoreductase [Patescibacteria group bacterium]